MLWCTCKNSLHVPEIISMCANQSHIAMWMHLFNVRLQYNIVCNYYFSHSPELGHYAGKVPLQGVYKWWHARAFKRTRCCSVLQLSTNVLPRGVGTKGQVTSADINNTSKQTACMQKLCITSAPIRWEAQIIARELSQKLLGIVMQ